MYFASFMKTKVGQAEGLFVQPLLIAWAVLTMSLWAWRN